MRLQFPRPLVAMLISLLLSWVSLTSLYAKQRQQTQPPKYYLPKAGFPAYAQAGGIGVGGGRTVPSANGTSDLPVVKGLHLDDGLDRKAGSGILPYNPGEPKLQMAWVRWDSRRFPLRIWISEGKQLPPVAWECLADDRLQRVPSMLKNPKSFASLQQASGWKPEMNDSIADGFELWRDMEKEGVIKFGFVDSPVGADILVFFT